MEKTTKETQDAQGAKVTKKEQPGVAIKMLAAKSKMLQEQGLISEEDLNTILVIHKNAVLKFMGG